MSVPVSADQLVVPRGHEIGVGPRSRGDARVGEAAYVAVIALVAIGVAVLVYAARAGVPISDDGAWVLQERYPLTVATLLLPFHSQLNTIPIALWAVIPSDAGKLAFLLATHAVAATLLAVFLVRRLGPQQGFAIALPLTVAGSAAFNLTYPWQIVFTIPVALVIVATWASVDRRRPRGQPTLVAMLLLAAVLSSNVGVVAIAGLGIWFVLERRWRQLLELAPAALLWIAWFVVFGTADVPMNHAEGLYPTSPVSILLYAASGISAGIGGIVGLGIPWAWLVGTAAIVVAIIRRPPVPVVAFTVALVAMFATLSLLRSAGDPNQAATSRYVYLVLFLLAGSVGAAAPRLPRSIVALGLIAALFNLRLLLLAV